MIPSFLSRPTSKVLENPIGSSFKTYPESNQFSPSPLPASWSRPSLSLPRSTVITSYQAPSFHFPLTGPPTFTCPTPYSQHTLPHTPKWLKMTPISFRVKSPHPYSGRQGPEDLAPVNASLPTLSSPLAPSSDVTCLIAFFKHTSHVSTLLPLLQLFRTFSSLHKNVTFHRGSP